MPKFKALYFFITKSQNSISFLCLFINLRINTDVIFLSNCDGYIYIYYIYYIDYNSDLEHNNVLELQRDTLL